MKTSITVRKGLAEDVSLLAEHFRIVEHPEAAPVVASDAEATTYLSQYLDKLFYVAEDDQLLGMVVGISDEKTMSITHILAIEDDRFVEVRDAFVEQLKITTASLGKELYFPGVTKAKDPGPFP